MQKREAPQPNEHEDIGRMAEEIGKIANGGGGDESDAARGTRKQEKVREGGLQKHTISVSHTNHQGPFWLMFSRGKGSKGKTDHNQDGRESIC